MRRVVMTIAGAVLCCCAFATHAAEPLLGSPPYHRHAVDLDVYPQNFAIAQDAHGIVYLGNADGVLEFDGEHWTLLRLPNREIVRSLAMAEDGRVYVGGYNTFGYIKHDLAGRAEFVDLTVHFRTVIGERELGDIWDTLVAPEGVYFRAIRDVFFWNPRTGKTVFWHHEGRFGAIGHWHGKTLLQFRGEGFKQRDGDDWKLLPATRGLTSLVFQLLPQRDGSLLTMGSDGAWWRLDQAGVTAATMPVGMPSSAHFGTSLALSDGSLAFASRDGMVYIVDELRHRERHFKVDNGNLSGLSASVDGGFLASADDAFYRITWPSQWTVLGSEHGVSGSLIGMTEWNGVHFMLSDSGSLRATRSSTGALGFEAYPADGLAVYDILPLAADRALLARDYQLTMFAGGQLHDLPGELLYPRMFRASRFHPGRVYLGTEAGLRVLNVAGSVPILVPVPPAEFEMRVSSLVEPGPDEVWIGTERHGLWRYKVAADGSLHDARRFGEADGLAMGPIQEVAVALFADGSLVAGTRKGLFRYERGRFSESGLGNLGAARAPDEILRPLQSPNGDQWAFGNSRIFLRTKNTEWREQDIGNLRRGALQGYHFEADGTTVFISDHALLLHDNETQASSRQKPGVVLRAVTQILPNGDRHSLTLDTGKPIHLAAGDFGVAFDFALPDLTREGAQHYRGRLLGVERDYSEWSRAHSYTYSELTPGEYRLEVQAMDSLGRISAIAPYRLIVDPAWYDTSWIRIFWLFLSAGVVWCASLLFVRRRTRRLANEKHNLETTVTERTSELADANRRLEMMANLDGLTGIPNRRRLDEYLAVVWSQCRERARPMSVLVIDVDRFKEFNDRHGHLAGDELLKQLVLRLGHCLRRAEDLLARYGGEEFMVVLPGADLGVAMALAETMRAAVVATELGVTVSIGVASRIPLPETTVHMLIDSADTALYSAKNAGRNRAVSDQLAGSDHDG